MAGKRKRTKKRERTIARRRRSLPPAVMPAAGDPPSSPATLLLELHEMVASIGAHVERLLSDGAEARTEHRQMADRLGDVDNRLGRCEATLVKIEPVVWNHETDKQRAIGGRALIANVVTRGRVVYALAMSAGGLIAGWFGYAAVNAPPVKLP